MVQLPMMAAVGKLKEEPCCEPRYALVFDLDGTLIRCKSACTVAWRQALLGAAQIDASAIRPPTSGGTDEVYLHTVFSNAGAARSGFTGRAAAVRDLYFALLTNCIASYGISTTLGCRAFLEEARASGHLLAVATGNYRQSALIKLRNSSLLQLFDVISTCDDGLTRADILRDALRQLNMIACARGLRLAGSFYFGDTERDVDAAEEVGIPAILISTSEARNGHVLALGPDFYVAQGGSIIDRLTQWQESSGR